MNSLKFKKLFPIIISGVIAVISFLTTFLIAKPLGPVIYGRLQTYVGTIQTLSLVSSLGLNLFFTKKIQFEHNKKGFFTKWFLLMCFWSLIIFPLYFLIAVFWLKTISNHLFILFVCIASFFNGVVIIVSGYYLGNYQPTKSSIFESLIVKLGLFLFSLICVTVLNIVNDFPEYYLIGYLIIYIVLGVYFIIHLFRKTQLKFSKQEILSLASFFALSCTYSLNSSLSKVIGAEFYENYGLVGAYSVSLQIVSIASLFAGVITTMAKPRFASLTFDHEKLFSYYRMITRINAFIVIPFCLGFIIQAKPILQIIGPDYVDYFGILIILCIGTILTNLSGPIGGLLAMAGHEKLELFNGLINFGTFIISAFALKGIGIYGLALANVIAIISTEVMKFIEVKKVYNRYSFTIKNLIHFLIIALISGSVFFVISLIPNIFILFTVDIIVGLGLILAFNIINPNREDKYFFVRRND